MLGWLRRGCTANCLGCLLPVLLVLALVLFAVHLLTTPPGYAAVTPASSGALLLPVQEAAAELSQGSDVSLLHLDDAQATALLRDSIGDYDGLSDLQVHILQGKVLVSGRTAILGHPLVISGPVSFRAGRDGAIDLEFTGLSIGQMPMPKLIPQLLARNFQPSINLSQFESQVAVNFVCEASRPNQLAVGISIGTLDPGAAAAACSASS